ncbi:MAG: A/G-specific adenine glycosylase [Aestuariivirga sp.]
MAEQGPNSGLTAKLLAWYDKNARQLPWRDLPGTKPDPYRVWLSEIMLQQTTVGAVKDYFLKFVKLWPNVHTLAAAPIDDVMKAWAGLGYYARARNLQACAKIVSQELSGKFPESRDELAKLPGIGPYTSAAIAAIAFDEPVAAIDGNVERVISRYYCIEEPLPTSKSEIRRYVEPLVPDKRPGDFAQALMDLGATTCTPKSPGCDRCPWGDSCTGRLRGMATALPRKTPKQKIPTRFGHVYWIENGAGDVIIRQRPRNGLLGGMTEFPSSDWTSGKKAKFKEPFEGQWKKYPGLVEHTFTHFHLELEVWKAQSNEPMLHGKFASPAAFDNEALPSLMLKVAAHVLGKRQA